MTSNSGAGHVGPLLAFAQAFMRTGHDVLLAAPARARDAVLGAGIPFHALADPPAHRVDAIIALLPSLPDEEQGVRMMQEVFAGHNARASLPGVLRALADYRPDLVLREPTEYAGLLAAEQLRAPHGRIAIMAAATESWGVPVVAGVLDRHRARLGLRRDPSGRRIADSPYLTVIPEAMEDPDDIGPRQTMRFREPDQRPWTLPDWWGLDERPLVYVSYGSVAPTLSGFPAQFDATVAALGRLDARVLFTVGNDVELDALGPVPVNVHVERWIPQHAVMPHAAAMVGHGGAGSTRMALAAGVPLVVVPSFADQPRNGERVAALGAGITVRADALAGLDDAVRRLLDEPSYADAARGVAAEVSALPHIDSASEALGELLTIRRAA